MSIYLVRYFLNPQTGARQHHLLLEDSDWVMAEHVPIDRSESRTRFFEECFQSTDAAVLAFDRLAAQTIADGYFLTDNSKRFPDDIPDDAKPKPAWQQAIDRYYLAMLHQSYDVTLPDEPLARAEPMWMHLEASREWRFEKERAAGALPLALAARAELKRRKSQGIPRYTWSLPGGEHEAALEELLYCLYRQLDDVDNAFVAIVGATESATNTYRSEQLALMQCYAFPQYREDGFDTAYRYSRYGYDDVIAHPDYAAYAARRDAEIASGDPVLRWHQMSDPSSAAAIAAAEDRVGAELPADYREFLASRGKSRLDLRRGKDTTTLTFAAASDIADWGKSFQDWLDISGDKDERFSEDWRRELGIDRARLWSIATPWDNSRCLVMSLAPDATHGHCFLWDHDDAYLLVPIGKSFSEAVSAIESGFASDDNRVKTILG